METLDIDPMSSSKLDKMISEHKEKKIHRKFRTSSANLHSKKQRRQNMSPPKGQSQQQKTSRQPSQRSLSAKKPGLPQIFQEQRSQNSSLLPISAICWSVTDAISGQQIFSKMSSEVREMASLTKMMTIYVCYQLSLKYNINPELEEVIIPRIAAYTGGTSAFLRENERISLKDLYYGLMLPSGNDAAIALAHHFGKMLMKNPLQLIKVRQQIISQQQQQLEQKCNQKQQSPDYESRIKNNSDKEQYMQNQPEQLSQQSNSNISAQQLQDQRSIAQSYIQKFVREMNKYAQKLGMRDSQFSNPHGLSSKSNRSTCEDLSKVALSIINIPDLLSICNTKNHQCSIYHTIKKEIRKVEWVNTNKLLWDETGEFQGVKTGCTDNAGPCLCVYYKDKQNVNIELIITVLCCKNPERRFEDSSKLARWAASKLKSSTTASNQITFQAKFTFYNPFNNNSELNNQKYPLSKSIVLHQIQCNDNQCDKLTYYQEQNEKKEEKINTFGNTMNSISQINSACNLNNSFITHKRGVSVKQPTKEAISPLFDYKKQNRINKFINANITQIQNHHFNLNTLNYQEDFSYTDRSKINKPIYKGTSESNQSSLLNKIQRDRSARSFQSSNNKSNAINIIKKHIEHKVNINSTSNPKIKTTKIQNIISQINNNPNGQANNKSQIPINSSQSTLCSTTQVSQQNSSTHRNYQDNIFNQTESIGNGSNNYISSRLSPTISLLINTHNKGGEEEGHNSSNNINSPLFQSENNSLNKQDNQLSQLNILLKGGIQYRSEIRDSIKKPIGGGNSNVNATQRGMLSFDKSIGSKDQSNNEDGIKSNNGTIVSNNENHNIKIFSKSKKKRYIISCLANIS